MGHPAFELSVLAIRDEAPNVKTFRLRRSDGARLPFLPGQFLQLAFPQSPADSRAYSLASSPLETDAFELTLAQAGVFTGRLFELKEGDSLLARGPFGKWTYSDDFEHAVLISGGTGLAPLRAMARYVIEKRLPNRLSIVYSARTPSAILYRDELASWAVRPNIKILTTITRPQEMAPGDKWDGPTGRIGLELIRDAAPDLTQAHFLLCGPKTLVTEMVAALAGAGVSRERIRFENWGEF